MSLPFWADEPVHLTDSSAQKRERGKVTADLLVVGLGASGLAAVHEGLDRGLRVIGIDAGTVGGGAAGRNGGFALAGLADFHHDAVRRHGRERAVAAFRLTLDGLARGTPTFRNTGSLRIAASADEIDDCREHLAALGADGLPGEWYDGPEGVGLLFPMDGVIQPLDRCRAMAADAVARGATLCEGMRWPEAVDRGLVHAPVTVLAIDGVLDRVVPSLAGRVRTTRLQALATTPVAPRYDRPVYRRWGYDYWQQLPSGEVVLGGRRDRFADDEWAAETATPTDDVQSALDELLRDVVLPGDPGDGDVRITHRWAGLVGYTDDHLPIIEAVAPDIVACGAYSGTGNIVGVLAGRAAVELALTGASATADLLAGR